MDTANYGTRCNIRGKNAVLCVLTKFFTLSLTGNEEPFTLQILVSFWEGKARASEFTVGALSRCGLFGTASFFGRSQTGKLGALLWGKPALSGIF